MCCQKIISHPIKPCDAFFKLIILILNALRQRSIKSLINVSRIAPDLHQARYHYVTLSSA